MSVFKFKHFDIQQSGAAMKVGTDSMILGTLIDADKPVYALDVGAGTGVLSLMVAQRYVDVTVDAVELEGAAFEDCQFNIESSQWKERVHGIHTDVFAAKLRENYDLIFSNPPFYRDSLQNANDAKSMARHEADFGASRFFELVSKHLSPNGRCWMIFPYADRESWLNDAHQFGLNVDKEFQIRGKVGGEFVRSVVSLSFNAGEPVAKEITIRNQEGGYTDQYINLTLDYHGVKL